MAKQTTVGNLAVDMTLNSAAFQADFSRLTKSMEVNSKAVENSMGFIKLGLGAVTAGIGALGVGLTSISFIQLIDGSLNAAKELKSVADQLGASTTELQEFRYAGGQAGVAAGDMDNALKKLNTQIGLAAAGSAKQKDLFEALGVSVQGADGKARAAYDVFVDLAGSISKIENPATRAAAAGALLGEELGPKLLPLLAKGSEGLRTLRDDAARLGVVLSEEAITKSSEAAKEIGTLKQVLSINISNAVAENAGAIVELTNALIGLAVAAAKIPRAVEQSNRNLEILAANPGRSGFEASADRIIPFGFGRTQDIGRRNLPKGGRGSGRASMDDPFRLREPEPEAPKVEGPTENERFLAKLLAGGGDGKKKTPREKAADTLAFPTPEELDKALADMQRQAEAGVRRATDLIATAAKAEGKDIGDAIIGEDGLMSDSRWAELQLQAERYVELTKQAEQFATQFAASLDSAFEDAILSGRGLGDALKGLGEDLLRLVLRMTVTIPLAQQLSKALSGLLSGGGGGGFLGGLFSGIAGSFGGALAGGGPASPGSWYLTGEQGPELFVPKVPGMVLPADATRGLLSGGGGTVINVDARGATDPAATERQVVAGILASRAYTDRAFESSGRYRLARGAGA